jgi:hypothetical protein
VPQVSRFSRPGLLHCRSGELHYLSKRNGGDRCALAMIPASCLFAVKGLKKRLAGEGRITYYAFQAKLILAF